MSRELEKINPFEVNFADLRPDQIQGFIFAIEDELKKYPTTEIPLENYFSHDVNGRIVTIPADVYMTGAVHKFETMNILLEGEVTVLSIDGFHRMKAPHVFVSSPNAKRLFKTHTEVKWMTVHGTTEKDPDKIRDYYTHNNKEESCQWLSLQSHPQS